jgi:hypothetical protein
MPKRVVVDDKLPAESPRPDERHTKSAVLRAASDADGMRRRQLRILELFHRIDFDSGYDHKVQRNRR